ncbi:FG-GAP-like repeat-containing protein [Cohnella fermenti]|uniref:VCBS repeat-containing protein n=1 Tax=Cohnella fermenti TaxID=2565925 RepID=A0A4S4C929_9BACL|nr:FG-GAP-like repeat-containing protein [Cohnella fermenti]THF83860.1 hypothetical protein E6C55_04050 [Cohnella fermenti]
MTDTGAATASLAGCIDIRQAGPRCKILLGDLNGDGRMELVLVQADNRQDVRYIPHQTQCLTAYDLDGRMLWQRGKPDAGAGSQGSDYPAQVVDLDGDGRLEVVCVMHDRLLVLNGATGEPKRAFALPHPEAHDCIVAARLTGGGFAGDLLLKDRYRTMWALDRNGQVLWKHEGNTGHYPWVYDFDGDGLDEIMVGYDLLDHDGTPLWSCRDLEDHADCIWVGDVNGDGEPELVIGGSVTVMYDASGNELWRYSGSIESQHIALGRFRPELPGLQIAGLDRITREDDGKGLKGKDGLFLLDSAGKELWKEDRAADGWLTIIDTLSNWEPDAPDYILAFRRGGMLPALYDGDMRVVVGFPTEGYAVHADLCGTGLEQVVLYTDEWAHIYSSVPLELRSTYASSPLPQPKRLSNSTLYPGGEAANAPAPFER